MMIMSDYCLHHHIYLPHPATAVFMGTLEKEFNVISNLACKFTGSFNWSGFLQRTLPFEAPHKRPL